MSITLRHYQQPDDFALVGDFLVENFKSENRDGNWLQPTWEYMHSHPYLDASALDKIGIWEDAGLIVAVVHYESRLGEVFFEVRSGYDHLKPTMLAYAETHLYGMQDGRRYVQAFANDFDSEFEAMLKERGYQIDAPHSRPMSRFTIPDPFPEIRVPQGFVLKSLADDNDLHKIHRVLWRGFNHPGEPPEDGIADRLQMQSTPNFNKDLNMVVEAPDGNFVAFGGMWYEVTNQFAYVEPVATDPDFRRMGLGRAAVLEGIRRSAALGARVAFVGSDLKFYQAIGFEKLFTSNCWLKYL